MADETQLSSEQVAEMRKKRTFRKFTFRGVDLDKLLDLSMEVSGTLYHCFAYGPFATIVLSSRKVKKMVVDLTHSMSPLVSVVSVSPLIAQFEENEIF